MQLDPPTTSDPPRVPPASAVLVDAAAWRPRIRFGIGTLMLVTAVLSGQYALFSYWGVVAAMAVPPVLCALVLLAVLVCHLGGRYGAFGKRGWRLKPTTFNWAILYIFLLGVSAYVAGGAQLAYKEFMRYRLASRLQEDLGFTHTTKYLWSRQQNRSFSAVVVRSVMPGGAFEGAGLGKSDAIVTELDAEAFFQMLDENRGQEVNLRVAKGAGSRPFDDCTKLQLTVVVPQR